MDHFHYIENKAYCENIALEDLATEYGTPVYIYSKATLKRHLARIREAFRQLPNDGLLLL